MGTVLTVVQLLNSHPGILTWEAPVVREIYTGFSGSLSGLAVRASVEYTKPAHYKVHSNANGRLVRGATTLV
jgi:hypothetical protein